MSEDKNTIFRYECRGLCTNSDSDDFLCKEIDVSKINNSENHLSYKTKLECIKNCKSTGKQYPTSNTGCIKDWYEPSDVIIGVGFGIGSLCLILLICVCVDEEIYTVKKFFKEGMIFYGTNTKWWIPLLLGGFLSLFYIGSVEAGTNPKIDKLYNEYKKLEDEYVNLKIKQEEGNTNNLNLEQIRTEINSKIKDIKDAHKNIKTPYFKIGLPIIWGVIIIICFIAYKLDNRPTKYSGATPVVLPLEGQVSLFSNI